MTDYCEEDCPLCGGIGEVEAMTERHQNGESVGCPHCIQMQLEAEVAALNIKISAALTSEAAAIAACEAKSKALEEAKKALERIAMNISGDTCAQVVAGEALRSVDAQEGGAA